MSVLRPVSRAGAFLIPLAMALAACSGSSGSSGSPAAAEASGTAAPPVPPASSGTEASQAPGSQAPAASDLPIPSFDISSITAALANVDSYRVSIKVDGVDTYSGVVVTKPVPARDVKIKDGTRVVVIGPDAWVSQGGGPLTKVPAAMASGLFAAFDPSVLLAAFSAPAWAQSSLDQGVEKKNGVDARHYHIDSTTLVNGFTGLPAGAMVDFWIATDGGYLVGLESTGTTGGNLSIEVDGINDPANKIQTPS